MYENILFEKKDGVAYLTLNRPDRLNALNGAVLKELDDALAAIDGDAEIRVLVVRGAGEKALAAGADITEMQSMEAEAGMAFGAFGQKVFAKIEALRQPSIAMIPGFALGGGCVLALACDIRIASEKARFGRPDQQTKRCIRHGLESGLESGLSYEAQAFGLCFSTKEQKDRMRAFVNRRR